MNDQNDLRNRNADTIERVAIAINKMRFPDVEPFATDYARDLARIAIAALEAGRSSGDSWPTVRARLELAIEHGDAHGWYTARNELLGVIGSDYAAAPQQPPPVGVDPSKMLRGKVRPGGAFGIAAIEVDCADLGPNTIGDGHEILIHNLTKNPLSHQQPDPDEAALQAKADGAFNEYLRGD